MRRVVIIGGGAAGFATARAYRRSGGDGEVTILAAEPSIPYRRPPLSKAFLRGEMEAAELELEPASWFEAHGVDLRLGVSAEAIDPERGTVSAGGSIQLDADAIVLATGAEPVRPPVPGAEHPRVLTFRTLSDSRALAVRTRPGRRVVVIGTGFIGCEIAGSLALRGVDVTLVSRERLPQIDRLGEEPARRIAGWLGELGVELVAQAAVGAIADGRSVELEDGRRIDGDGVVLGAGVRPRGELAARAGLETEAGAVLVDEAMRAGRGRGGCELLAVGDVAFAHNATAGRRLRVEHWGDALGHGEVAGRFLAGASAGWRDVPGFWTTIGERTLKYAAWGDGHDSCRLVEHGDGGAFTAWYERDGVAVGVLTHERDEDYERGRELIASGRGAP